MADTIKIGSFEVSSFKVGSSDCKIYLGDTLLYPQSITVKDYLRFVARENASFTFSTNSIQYSLNSGRTWTSLAANTSTPTIASGETIYWRASGLTPTSSAGIGTFSSSGQFDIEGNIMSMLFGSNFENQTDLTGYDYAFVYLFRNNTNVVNASGMTLPATTLVSSCYYGMFRGCTSLTTAPELLAATLASSCYQYMFYYCSSLTTAPVLNATTLANYCYQYMFYGCTNLTTAPELPAATLAINCYANMFSSCASLTTAPILSATTLASNCYRAMFNGCSSLSAVTCLATSGIDTNNSANTANWLVNTATNGTFTRAANASWYCGAIPSTWTVTPAYERTYAWRKAPTSDYVCDTTTYIKYYKEYYSYSDDNGCTWTKVTPTSSRTSSDIIERDSTDCGYTGSSYTELSYIERTDNYKGSVDLGLDVNVNFKAVIQINATSINGSIFLGDRTTTSDQNDFRFFAASNRPYFDIGSSRAYITTTSSFITGVTYTVTLENYKLTVVGNGYNRSQTGTRQTSSVVNQFHWYLFKNITITGDCAKVYYIKIWNGNTLVGDFIPVRRNSDNVITMYNKVTNTFCDVLGTLTGG